MCGGTSSQNRAGLRHRGLSPRVRGNPGRLRVAALILRSIPACAGEPFCCAGWGWSRTVYPRVCGGTGAGGVVAEGIGGLSPRVRGNRPSRWGWRRPARSIPACAGEPTAPAASSTNTRVYPRVCGGTQGKFSGAATGTGLSPRVRGNRPLHFLIGDGPRSIPACAGEPSCSDRNASRAEVYPRVCGGTPAATSRRAALRGLSPRVRGNHHPHIRLDSAPRSIPACAGEPARCWALCPAPTVYPRVCGGTAP